MQQVKVDGLDAKLSQQLEVDQLSGAPLVIPLLSGWPKFDFLAQQTEVGIMTQQTQHDQVGVQAIQTMPYVGVVIMLSPRQANVFHDLVLAFSWYLVSGQNDLHILPI
jgi:hypothetical protein